MPLAKKPLHSENIDRRSLTETTRNAARRVLRVNVRTDDGAVCSRTTTTNVAPNESEAV